MHFSTKNHYFPPCFPPYNQEKLALAGKKEHVIDEYLAILTNKINQLSSDKNSNTSNNIYIPPSPEKIQVSNLPQTNTKLIGRINELILLNTIWKDNKKNIVILKAMGGTGKTALINTWLDNLAIDNFCGASAVYTWSFYTQGSTENNKQANTDEFFDKALSFFGYQGDPIVLSYDKKAIKLAELINQQRTLLILDGLEPLLFSVGSKELKDKALLILLKQLAAYNQGLCLISSRQNIVELINKPMIISHELEQLKVSDQMGLIY